MLAPVKALAERNAIDLSGGDDDAIVTVLVALAGRSPNAPEGAEIQFRLRYRSNLHRLTLAYAGAIHQLLGSRLPFGLQWAGAGLRQHATQPGDG